MLVDSLLPIPFWAEVVNTACYVQNRVLVTKPYNKTPYVLLLGRTPSIGFMRPFGCLVTILNTLDPLGEDNVQQYVLFPLRSSGSKNPQNTDDDAVFKVKEPEFEEFEDFSDTNINEVNADSTPVPAVGQISTNSTNTFSAASSSNTVVNITYSDDDDVGAEADFTNLEITITVSPIPTTRVHKNHHVTQIIGDLSLATQTRSMARVVKDQGGLTQINNKDFHTCMFACFLSQEEPMRVHQDLKDLSWIEAMQEELLQFKMQKVWVLVNLLNGKRAIGFEDPDYPNKVYKVVKILYGYIKLIELASNPIDTKKPLLKDPNGEDVDMHTYRSMIGSLMYLTSSRPDIMFAVCACAYFQVTPKVSHLHEIKRIFRYLKGKPHLGLWYPKDLPFNLVAYSDSDYAGASMDRKSTTGGCQFLRCRLISW
nr:hypothetical protein [Tanacetum cinerariifolium]